MHPCSVSSFADGESMPRLCTLTVQVGAAVPAHQEVLAVSSSLGAPWVTQLRIMTPLKGYLWARAQSRMQRQPTTTWSC